MAYKAKLVFPDGEEIEVDGEYDSYEEAYDAGVETIGEYHQGNSVLELAGEEYSDDEPEIEVYEV